MQISKRRSAFVIAVYMLFMIFLLSCKTVQTVRCKATSLKPVVLIGVNGTMTTVMVPFCDTLQVIPKVPDTLRVQ
jgi:hypothetical protein